MRFLVEDEYTFPVPTTLSPTVALVEVDLWYGFGADLACGTLVAVGDETGRRTTLRLSLRRRVGREHAVVAVAVDARGRNQHNQPVVTREILYTAVTRAKRKVTIYATPDIVADAITHRTERAAGLRDALWG